MRGQKLKHVIVKKRTKIVKGLCWSPHPQTVIRALGKLEASFERVIIRREEGNHRWVGANSFVVACNRVLGFQFVLDLEGLEVGYSCRKLYFWQIIIRKIPPNSTIFGILCIAIRIQTRAFADTDTILNSSPHRGLTTHSLWCQTVRRSTS